MTDGLDNNTRKSEISRVFSELIDTRSFFTLAQRTKYRRQVRLAYEEEDDSFACPNGTVVGKVFRMLNTLYEHEKFNKDEIFNLRKEIEHWKKEKDKLENWYEEIHEAKDKEIARLEKRVKLLQQQKRDLKDELHAMGR